MQPKKWYDILANILFYLLFGFILIFWWLLKIALGCGGNGSGKGESEE